MLCRDCKEQTRYRAWNYGEYCHCRQATLRFERDFKKVPTIKLIQTKMTMYYRKI